MRKEIHCMPGGNSTVLQIFGSLISFDFIFNFLEIFGENSFSTSQIFPSKINLSNLFLSDNRYFTNLL